MAVAPGARSSRCSGSRNRPLLRLALLAPSISAVCLEYLIKQLRRCALPCCHTAHHCCPSLSSPSHRSSLLQYRAAGLQPKIRQLGARLKLVYSIVTLCACWYDHANLCSHLCLILDVWVSAIRDAQIPLCRPFPPSYFPLPRNDSSHPLPPHGCLSVKRPALTLRRGFFVPLALK